MSFVKKHPMLSILLISLVLVLVIGSFYELLYVVIMKNAEGADWQECAS